MKFAQLLAWNYYILCETASSLELMWDTLTGIWYGFLRNLPTIFIGIVIILLTSLITKFITRFEKKFFKPKLKDSQITLIIRLSAIVVWFIGLLIALTVFFPNMTPTRGLAGLGLGSVAVGFAFRDIFENFFAGMLILWRFPFENGDFIVCQGIEGSVVDVTIRNTLIRRLSGELVVIPNATIFKNPVDILTNQKLRRTTLIAGVAYGENVDQARGVIEKAVKNCKSVSKIIPAEVLASQFAESSINFEIDWWTDPTPMDLRRSRDEVVAAVKKALDEAGIEIPFPYRTLNFKKPVQIENSPRQTAKPQ